MSHLHAQGYNSTPDAQLVALADVVDENARAFAEQHCTEAAIYSDYHQMLANEALDIVSIGTWPHLHTEMVLAAANAGVKAIHCEKPMATTYGDSLRMVQECDRLGVQLTFNHQRRFNEPFIKAKELLDSGAIGKLERLEASCGNLYDWGTHWFDMMFYYNDEAPAEWVIGQIDLRNGPTFFGVDLEGQGISNIKFSNGVHGLLMSGANTGWGASNRLTGTDGVIEVGPPGGGADFQHMRIMGKGRDGWEWVPTSESIHGPNAIAAGVRDVVDALKNSREPQLSGHRALRATELIFATYESSRRRGRVDLPLDIEDSPLAAMQAEAATATRA
jgi:predicted dehydrogenase